MSAPLVTVVIPSHARPLRLRWLLNALQEQTLARAEFEVVVAHDAAAPATSQLLQAHALGVHELAFAPGPSPAAKRNAGWRAGRAPYIAFTDDDVRPARDWLERLLSAAAPDVVVQGRTQPDPDEAHLVERVPHARTVHVTPPTVWGETCNVLYPRALLERLDGFDEVHVTAGEDTDLLQRALAAGARQVAAADAVVFHMVDCRPLPAHLRSVWRWGDVPAVVKRHPRLRAGMPLGIFWRTRHAKLLLALAGAALARGRPLASLAVLPWIMEALPAYGRSPRGLARAAAELPGRAAIDAVEMTALARGSIRHRTLLL